MSDLLRTLMGLAMPFVPQAAGYAVMLTIERHGELAGLFALLAGGTFTFFWFCIAIGVWDRPRVAER